MSDILFWLHNPLALNEWIEFFTMLPSLKIAEKLLDKGLNPSKLLYLVLSCKPLSFSEKFNTKQQKLVDIAFALNYGFDYSHVSNNPEVMDALETTEPFIGRNQDLLRNQLLLFNEKLKLNDEYFKKLGQNDCSRELVMLWLCSKLLQFYSGQYQPQQPELPKFRYDNDWFRYTTKLIATWNGDVSKVNITMKDLKNGYDKDRTKNLFYFQRFGFLISQFLRPNKDEGDSYYDVANYIKTYWAENFKTLYIDASDLTLEPEIVIKRQAFLLSKTIACTSDINDNDMVFIVYGKSIIGLFKHENICYLYNPNGNLGEYAIPYEKKYGKNHKKNSAAFKAIEPIISQLIDNENRLRGKPKNIRFVVIGDKNRYSEYEKIY